MIIEHYPIDVIGPSVRLYGLHGLWVTFVSVFLWGVSPMSWLWHASRGRDALS